MTKKKSEPNPIEKAIGDRAKPKKTAYGMENAPAPDKTNQVIHQSLEPIPLSNSHPSEIPDEPTPTEMLDLEELNRQTEERLRDDPEPQTITTAPPETGTTPQESITIPQESTTIPASQPDLPPETETCSPESPPQKIEKEFHPVSKPIPNIEKLPPNFKVKHTYKTGVAGCVPAEAKELPPLDTENELLAQQDKHRKHVEPVKALEGEGYVCGHCGEASSPPDFAHVNKCPNLPTEDIELTALRRHIFEEGFVVSTVAYHIVSLCSQPMVTPSTTTWDFAERPLIPEMVFALLKQPGYLEEIWPSLKIVMSSNIGNAAWCAGIATTFAFFDVIRTLPILRGMKQ